VVRAPLLALQLLNGRRLVAKGLQESVGKFLRVKGGFGKLGNGFFDLNGVHNPTGEGSGLGGRPLLFIIFDAIKTPNWGLLFRVAPRELHPQDGQLIMAEIAGVSGNEGSSE